MSRKKNNTLVMLLLFFIVAIFALPLVTSVVKDISSPSGMYVKYGETKFEATNDGARFEYVEKVTMTIDTGGDWGLYKVTDCTVKVLPNTTEECKFSYTLDGDETPYYYARLTDVSAAFMEDGASYDGKGLKVDSGGRFQLVLAKDYTMITALERIHAGQEVALDEELNLSAYPYFILRITSPDGKEVINIPFTLKVIEGTVTDVELDTTKAYF